MLEYPPESINIIFVEVENSFIGESLDDFSENTAEALIRLNINDEFDATANDQTENYEPFDEEVVFGPVVIDIYRLYSYRCRGRGRGKYLR